MSLGNGNRSENFLSLAGTVINVLKLQRDSDYIVIKRTYSQLELEDFYRHTKSIGVTKTTRSRSHTPHHGDHYDTTVLRRTTVVKNGGGTNWCGGALAY
jgi:hypothetical protein